MTNQQPSGNSCHFFNDTATTEIYTLSLHDALPILFHGGSLCQNVTPLRVNTRHRPLLLPMQTVRLVATSLLGQVMRAPVIGANRIHSQAIKQLGKNLKVTAVDNDLFVQAIESTQGQWLMGLQWHPEYLLYHAGHRRIFGQFLEAALTVKLARLSQTAPAH